MSSEPFAGLSFKIQADPHVGKLTYIRVYSGKIAPGLLHLQRQHARARARRPSRSYARQYQRRSRRGWRGEIVGVVGLKDTRTGDTLCVKTDHPISLEGPSPLPDPVISLAIEPKPKPIKKNGMALAVRLAEEDPTFRIHTNHETGQTVIAGMGELHLEIIVDRLKARVQSRGNVGAPQVAYRETITKDARG